MKAADQGQRFNVAPTLDVYAVIERDDERRLGTLRWGFLPFWAKQMKGAPSPINARLESVSDSKMFARAFEERRCIIPADGFYEWKKREGSTKKQPYYFSSPDEAPLAFAGIWSVWRDPTAGDEAEPVFSCAIVTTEAAGPIADVHDRMPLILPKTLWSDWLTATREDAPHLLQAVSALGAPAITARTITDRVNNVRNEGAELLEPGTVPEGQ